MRKTFALQDPKHAPARVVAAVKSELRKYVKRERRKPLAEGADFCDFHCRIGPDAASAGATHVDDLGKELDALAAAGAASAYVEILAAPGFRKGGKAAQ